MTGRPLGFCDLQRRASSYALARLSCPSSPSWRSLTVEEAAVRDTLTTTLFLRRAPEDVSVAGSGRDRWRRPGHPLPDGPSPRRSGAGRSTSCRGQPPRLSGRSHPSTMLWAPTCYIRHAEGLCAPFRDGMWITRPAPMTSPISVGTMPPPHLEIRALGPWSGSGTDPLVAHAEQAGACCGMPSASWTRP